VRKEGSEGGAPPTGFRRKADARNRRLSTPRSWGNGLFSIESARNEKENKLISTGIRASASEKSGKEKGKRTMKVG